MAGSNVLECGFTNEVETKKSQTLDAYISKEQSAATAPSIHSNHDQEIPSAEEDDPNVVGWDGPDDPENPHNWPAWLKNVAVAIASAIVFITPLASSMFAPGVPELMHEFGSHNSTLASFVVSIFLLGFAVGPLALAPASELYGRCMIFNITNVSFVICTIACARAPNLNSLIAFRFFSGIFGSAPLTIGGGTITDVIPPEKRGASMALFAMGPLMGPIIGPVVGGFLTEARGWRWVFYLLAICSGTVTIITFFFLKETYAPAILEAKAKRLRKSTGNLKLRAKFTIPLSPKEHFSNALARPFKVLFMSPIVLFLSTYMAIVYGYLYLLFTTFPTVFGVQYHFSTSTVGLAYLGLGVGCMIGLAYLGIVSDRILISRTKKFGESKPEFRLPPMAYGSPLIPIGLFWFGWSVEKDVHWIVPIIGTSFVGMGLLTVFMPVNTYIMDAYEKYSASALASTAVLRSILGACLPLAGPKMYASLGLGWGTSVMGFIAVAFMPMPFIFERYGERLRKRFPVGF
ncbi:putative MFS multidrug transporter [Trichophaea hybrida]|nr:putative MFS multidrug transporter [Trichophaea hybrida]